MKGRKEKIVDKQLNVGGNPLDDKIKQPSYDNTKRIRMKQLILQQEDQDQPRQCCLRSWLKA